MNSDEQRIRQLLEEVLDSGSTPEQVCADDPELLQEVRQRWRRLQSVDAQLEAMFPSSHSPGLGKGVPPPLSDELPQIPGYEVESFIGSGGMGVVYRARHLRLNRTVAIKMLLTGVHAARQELTGFMREAEALAAVRHPHIVQIFDIGDLEGLPYFSMEFVEGGNLAQKLAGAPMTPAETCALVSTLATAVQAAHAGGVVHRDLKPANILLTADGTPKIADFSLARQLKRDPALTLSSARVGTPSYMAPEQALGREAAFCPAVDIYALGAMLYELLTGRPPFRAATATETQRQVIQEEPAAPSRLNARVPRDLETICLKCLQKDPLRRYESAAALADDLNRFSRGEAILARRTGRVERLIKWVRRRPAQATIVAGTAVAAVVIVTLIIWFGWQRSVLERAIYQDLQDVALRAAQSDWSEARTALERAKARSAAAAAAGSLVLREQLVQAECDLDLVARIEAIRLNRCVLMEGRSTRNDTRRKADGEYAQVFSDLMRGTIDDNPQWVADRVMASRVRAALIGGLDDWADCTEDVARRSWLLKVLCKADRDLSQWRSRVRDPASWQDRARLEELARTVPPDEQSLPLLVSLGLRLHDAGGNAIPFLRKVQYDHPSDFWTNFALSFVMGPVNAREAIRYAQAAVVLSPGAAIAHVNLGVCLGIDGQLDEAIEHLKLALEHQPNLAIAHANLGNAYIEAGHRKEALVALNRALVLEPSMVNARISMGKCLIQENRNEEAITILTQALRLEPRHVMVLNNLGWASQKLGRYEDAVSYFRAAIEIDPEMASAISNMGNVYRSMQLLPEAVQQHELAIRLEPNEPAHLCSIARDLKLLNRVPEAIAYCQKALLIDPDCVEALHVLGLILSEDGRHEEAAEHLRHLIRVNPDLPPAYAALGGVLVPLGRFEEARDVLQHCIGLITPENPQFEFTAFMLKQCEHGIEIEARLPAVLRGEDAPANTRELLQFAQVSRIRHLNLAAARFYRDLFQRLPQIVNEAGSGYRFDAACVAVEISLGIGEDVADLTPQERREWRDQALKWMRADFQLMADLDIDKGMAERLVVGRRLGFWFSDQRLERVRGFGAADELDEDEAAAWQSLWHDAHRLRQRAMTK